VKHKKDNIVVKIIINAILILFSITCIFPIIWMIYSSLKTSPEFNRSIIALPEKLIFSNFVDAFRISHMDTYYFNTIFNAVISLFIMLLFSFIIAYFLARFQFKGRNLIYYCILVGMLIPVHALLIPMFIQFKNLGMFDKRFTLIIPYVAFAMPFAVFLIVSYLKSIPPDMEEASVIDGSGFVRMLFTIVMPLCIPILITVSILQLFTKWWNEFPFALVLVNSEKYKTIALGLMNFSSQYSTNYPMKMAALVLAILPVIIIYVCFNKKIIEGMIAGAVKG
jgi:raffinose/stachyose/melibiose transport system permease protein